MDAFLQKLKEVNENLTCAVCSQLCEDPFTFDKCFHSTCCDHVPKSELFLCPVCGTSNRKAKNVRDYNFEKAVAALKGLNNIFLKDNVSVPKKQNDFVELISTSSEEEKALKPIDAITECVPSKLKKDLEKRNCNGETPLHVACRTRKHDKVSELLKSGANPNTKDNAGWTPLHETVINGAIEIVELLLKHGALSDIPGCHNETPLHEAVRYKYADIAALLIEHGANVNTRNIKGETPLDLVGEDIALRDMLENSEPKTQTANILQVSALCIEQELEDMHLLPVSISKERQKQLDLLKKKHKNLNVETKFNKNVTHLITDVEDNRTCYSTVEILQAIVHGKWIMSSDWIDDQVHSETFSNFEEYEVGGIETPSSDGPRRARFNKYKQLPGLFDGCHFYLYGFKSKCVISKRLTFTKQSLSKLITDAGGKLLRREPNPESIHENETTIPYHASESGTLAKCSHYIIYHDSVYTPMYNMAHLKVLPIGWLVECIEKYELCDNYSFI